MNRRRFLAASALVTAGLVGGSPGFLRTIGASAPRKLKLGLPFVFVGGHAFEFVARQEGWKRRGLDVEIFRGSGSNSTVQAVGGGTFEFGEASLDLALKGVADGLDLVVIAAKLQHNAGGLMCVPEIKTPKQIEGKRVLRVAAGAPRFMVSAFAHATGLDEAKVDYVTMAPDKIFSAFLAGQADCTTIYLVSNGATIQVHKPGITTFLFADHGIDFLDLGILTTTRLLNSEPQLCQDFVDGAMEGLKVQLLEPERALETMKQARPELQRDTSDALIQQLANTNFLAISSAVEAHGLGYMARDGQERTRQAAMKFLGAKDLPPIERLFTNQFVGRVKLSPGEWTRAKAWAGRMARVKSSS